MNRALIKKLFSYGVVGGIGFLVDASILTLLSTKLGVNVYLSRLCSFTVAVFVTWLLNRRWVFNYRSEAQAPKVSNRTGEYLSYLTVQIGGALINLGVFSALLFYAPKLKAYPVIPLAVGSIAAMFFTFTGAQIWVFKPRRP